MKLVPSNVDPYYMVCERDRDRPITHIAHKWLGGWYLWSRYRMSYYGEVFYNESLAHKTHWPAILLACLNSPKLRKETLDWITLKS